MHMQLFTFVGSPNGRKVEAVINHLGARVDVVHLDFPAGLKTPEFSRINLNAMTPVLVDGDFSLWESSAIMQYLADKHADTQLLPRDPKLRADVVRWQFWEQRHFNRAFGTLAFEFVAKPHLGLERDEHNVASGLADLQRFVPVLEQSLDKRKFIVSDHLTLADYSLVTFESYRAVVPFDWQSFPNLNRYFDAIKLLPSWQAAASKNQLAAA
jgi:glutathione S-transferase